MSGMSAHRAWRLFKKSASDQYKYAKQLTSEQRGALEQALEARFRGAANSNEAREALTMWLSVQQARLRTHDTDHRNDHHSAQVITPIVGTMLLITAASSFNEVRENRRAYYDSPMRPEYQTAFDNFMRVIGDQSLSSDLRAMAEERLKYHWRSEKTIAPYQGLLLQQSGIARLAAEGYRMATDPASRLEASRTLRQFASAHRYGQVAQRSISPAQAEDPRPIEEIVRTRDRRSEEEIARTREIHQSRTVLGLGDLRELVGQLGSSGGSGDPQRQARAIGYGPRLEAAAAELLTFLENPGARAAQEALTRFRTAARSIEADIEDQHILDSPQSQLNTADYLRILEALRIMFREVPPQAGYER